jgi:nucleoside-diphosphate-sugar epimerase
LLGIADTPYRRPFHIHPRKLRPDNFMGHALVIGGTSLIGPPLVEALLDRGDTVTVMHRSAGTPFGARVAELRADRNDPDAVRAAVGERRFDVVFDNVYDWQHGTTADQVMSTVDALGHDGLERYVFMSSVAAYPDPAPGQAAFAEHAALRPASDPNLYGVQKAESEVALFRRAAEEGLPVATIRPAFVYGPRNPFPREAFFWDRLVAGRPIVVPEDGERTMQWVHAADVAEASIRAATRDEGLGEAFNLAGPPMTQNEFVRTLARAAGVDADLVHVPRARIEEAGGNLLEPPLYFGAYLDIPPLTVAGDKVRDALGVELRDIEAGMRDTFAWYREQDRPAPDTSWEDDLLASSGRT